MVFHIERLFQNSIFTTASQLLIYNCEQERGKWGVVWNFAVKEISSQLSELICLYSNPSHLPITTLFVSLKRQVTDYTTHYSGTPPYGHLVNTVTSLLRPLFIGPAKRPYIILLEIPVNAASPLMATFLNSNM